MKPEVSSGAVLEGKPSLTRTKRLTRFTIEQALRAIDMPLSVATAVIPKMPRKQIEIAKEIQSRKLANSANLDRRARTFLFALRENFGESLKQGLVLRPKTDNEHDITIQAVTHDTGRIHKTEADVVIVSKQRNVTRLEVGTVEPTVGAARTGGPVKPSAWVQVVDPAAESRRIFSSMDFGLPEQGQLVDVADRTFGEIEAACDQGNCEVYTLVA
ncbi:MAG TPA: hypothetical protein VFH99_00310 [Candidatus Saccharimonadales bacterium]|nr:hypothetical protein [Candidatus Saccharimonadales bacterium]